MAKAKQSATLQAMDTEKEAKPKTGRPTVMTDAVMLEICARIAGGETLNAVCRDPGLPGKSTVTRHLGKDSQFQARYAIARDALLEHWADEIIDIADDGTTDYIIKTGRNGHEYEAVDQEHIQRSRLRVDSRKWLLSKLKPETYGDRVIGELTGSVAVVHDIASLTEREKMRRFALFMIEDNRQPAIEGESSPVPAATPKGQHLSGLIRNTGQAPDVVENDDTPA
jgi:hypothetical protein